MISPPSRRSEIISVIRTLTFFPWRCPASLTAMRGPSFMGRPTPVEGLEKLCSVISTSRVFPTRCFFCCMLTSFAASTIILLSSL